MFSFKSAETRLKLVLGGSLTFKLPKILLTFDDCLNSLSTWTFSSGEVMVSIQQHVSFRHLGDYVVMISSVLVLELTILSSVVGRISSISVQR